MNVPVGASLVLARRLATKQIACPVKKKDAAAIPYAGAVLKTEMDIYTNKSYGLTSDPNSFFNIKTPITKKPSPWWWRRL